MHRIRKISLIGEFKGRVSALGDAIWQFRSPPRPCPLPTILPECLCPGYITKWIFGRQFGMLWLGGLLWNHLLGSIYCWVLRLTWRYLPFLTICWSAWNDYLDCNRTTVLSWRNFSCTTSIHLDQKYCVPQPPWDCTASKMGGPWYSLSLPWWDIWDTCCSCMTFILSHEILFNSNQSQYLCIIGIFGGPTSKCKKVVVLLQVHVPYLLCHKLLLFIALTIPSIHVVSEEW